jgi:hypothetical protein
MTEFVFRIFFWLLDEIPTYPSDAGVAHRLAWGLRYGTAAVLALLLAAFLDAAEWGSRLGQEVADE